MPLQGLQRGPWSGEPKKLADWLRLRRGERHAVCELWSHQDGWQLLLCAGGEPVMRQVCRSQEALLDTIDAWAGALRQQGWK